MAKYRVGVIGGGRKGTQHARAYMLNPLTEVVALADTDPENRELFCERFGVLGYVDYREMLEREQIDIAAPILPVRPNPEVIIGCAEGGVKGILCEKPLAASLEEADRTVAACRNRGVRFGAGDLDCNLPAFRKGLEIIESGELGEVRSINFRGGSGTEMSGGGCQIFSLMRMFAGGGEVAWVIGWVADDPFSDHDQGVAGYVRFVNGVEAFIHREGDARGRGFEVACTEGVFRSDGLFVKISKLRGEEEIPTWEKLEKIEGVLPETNFYGRRHTDFDEDGWRWPGDRNVATVQVMVDALENDTDPFGSGDNGRRVLEIAIGLRESHRRGHAPVALPLQDRSLRLIPHPARMENKKPIFGREKYMEQVLGFKKP